jgi:hypothetical protein
MMPPVSRTRGLPTVLAIVSAFDLVVAVGALLSLPAPPRLVRFELGCVVAVAVLVAAAWLLRGRMRRLSIAGTTAGIVLAVAVLASARTLARNVASLSQLYPVAVEACADPAHPLDWRIVCDAGLPCAEDSPFQVACEREGSGGRVPTRVFLVEGHGEGWEIGPEGIGRR